MAALGSDCLLRLEERPLMGSAAVSLSVEVLLSVQTPELKIHPRPSWSPCLYSLLDNQFWT